MTVEFYGDSEYAIKFRSLHLRRWSWPSSDLEGGPWQIWYVSLFFFYIWICGRNFFRVSNSFRVNWGDHLKCTLYVYICRCTRFKCVILLPTKFFNILGRLFKFTSHQVLRLRMSSKYGHGHSTILPWWLVNWLQLAQI